ncbi:MAG: HD domain-containing protein [Alistipes sp.]|nr:HD domain-containing protein [Alistipes sp.]
MINCELKEYVEREILPRYDHFDTAHRRDHVETVIEAALRLAEGYDVDLDMVYTIAAYHDTGLTYGRERHHNESRRIILEDRELDRWFTREQIATMADAAEDHRASSKDEPRTIYGRIVAEADRVIDSNTIIRRTIQYTLTHHPELNREEGYARMVEHLREKYDYGGYLKLWIEESDNAKRLDELRAIIANKVRLRELYDTIYDEEKTV